MKFSIRDLLWLTVLAAVLSAWLVDHRKQEAKIKFLEVYDPLYKGPLILKWKPQIYRNGQPGNVH